MSKLYPLNCTENVNLPSLKQGFSSVNNAIRVNVIPFHTQNGTYYRVRVGTYSDRRAAEDEARQLARQGFPVIIMEK